MVCGFKSSQSALIALAYVPGSARSLRLQLIFPPPRTSRHLCNRLTELSVGEPPADDFRSVDVDRSFPRHHVVVALALQISVVCETTGLLQAGNNGYNRIFPPQRPGWRSEQNVVTDPIRILCVEDHPVFREGLRTIIGYEPDMVMVGHAANAVQAIAEFRRLRPDVTLMDFRLPGANGVDVLIAIRGEFSQARVIMLTTSDGDADIQRAMRAGASAYILKSMPMEELLGVIRSVHSGRRHVPPEVAATLAEYHGRRGPHGPGARCSSPYSRRLSQ